MGYNRACADELDGDLINHEHLTEGLSGTEILAPGRSLQVSWTTQF